jgi:hypothetical protein
MTIAIATAVTGMALITAAAIGAIGGKLRGEFKAEVQAVKATFPVDKTPVERTYEFKCRNRKCSSVRFQREGGDGIYESQLTEEKRGVFTGTERVTGDDCPDSDSTSRRAIAHTVRITKASKSGKVKKIAGKSRYSWPQCPGDPSQTTEFTAVAK